MRVLTTKWFDNSQERIYQCKDMIIRSFKTCGIVANVDGSVDSQIIIWGLEGYVISGPEESFKGEELVTHNEGKGNKNHDTDAGESSTR